MKLHTLDTVTVHCPDDWEDEDGEGVIEEIEEAADMAMQAFANKLKEINPALKVEFSGIMLHAD